MDEEKKVSENELVGEAFAECEDTVEIENDVLSEAAEAPEDGTASEVNEEESGEKSAAPTSPVIVRGMIEIVSIVASSIITIMLLFTFVFRIVGVVGQSMEQTLHDGDWLLVTSHIYEPHRGDIVIVTQPNGFGDEPIVKRIIAVGGDTLNINFRTAEVTVNGKVLKETYLNTPTVDDEFAWEYPIRIPEGKVFVMGDNRQHSTDSRSSLVGMIDERYILGQVKFRFSPITDIKLFKDYKYE